MRDFRIPAITLPDLNLREARMPDVDLTRIDMRRLDPRNLDLSGVDTRRLRRAGQRARATQKPASPWAWIIVAAVAGFFAGWWLATATSARLSVRALPDRLHGRISDWRAARRERDDQAASAEWSDDERSESDTAPAAEAAAGSTDGTDAAGPADESADADAFALNDEDLSPVAQRVAS